MLNMIIREKIFVIPYVDQPVAFWEKLKKQFGKNIREVYFPIQHDCVGTGRPLLPIGNLYDFLSSRIFSTSVLINPVILPYPVEHLSDSILAMINHLNADFGVKSVSLTDIRLARLIRQERPQMNLTASVLMDIFTPQQASLLNGVFDTLVPASRVLKNLTVLKSLRKAFKGKIRLLVNESCLPNCLSRTQHFYEMSNREIQFPKSLCHETIAENPWITLT
jgi:collagenase-like PrtC family protease